MQTRKGCRPTSSPGKYFSFQHLIPRWRWRSHGRTTGAMFVNDINYQCCQLQQIYGFSPSEIGIKYNWMQLFSAAELSQIIQQIADIYYFKTIPGIRMNEALCISSVLSNTPTPPVLFSLRNKITATSLPDLQLSNKYQLNWVFPGQLMMVKGTSSSVFLHSLDSTCTWNLTNYVLYMYI